MMSVIGIIGGTGVYDSKMLENSKEERIDTFYGPVKYTKGTYQNHEVIFMPRHGKGHSIPPHLINYRANILGLKRLGVETVISTTAVGSLNPNMKPGDFVILDQFIDFTKNRQTTFFDGGPNGVVHTDMTHPYCPTLQKYIKKAGNELGFTVHENGVYVCTEGPRFETPAEIKMFAQWGGDVVGMTNVPEVCLAREAEICYASISIVTNFAAGISETELTHQEVVEEMERSAVNIQTLIKKVLDIYQSEDCRCRHALEEHGGFMI